MSKPCSRLHDKLRQVLTHLIHPESFEAVHHKINVQISSVTVSNDIFRQQVSENDRLLRVMRALIIELSRRRPK